MERILCPIDFSAGSSRACDWALMLAEKTGASLDLLHAWHFNAGSAPDTDAEKDSAIQLAQWKDALLSKGKPGLKVNTILKADFAANAILDQSLSPPADLIVMGTKGASGLGALLGSVAEKVVSECKVPVLIIPAESEALKPAVIIYGTDLHENDFHPLQALGKTAASFDAELAIVHIHTPAEALDQKGIDTFESLLRSQLKYAKMRLYIHNDRDVEQGITAFAEGKSGAVIAMVRKKKNFLRSIFERSHTRQMALHTHIPFMVFPEN